VNLGLFLNLQFRPFSSLGLKARVRERAAAYCLAKHTGEFPQMEDWLSRSGKNFRFARSNHPPKKNIERKKRPVSIEIHQINATHKAAKKNEREKNDCHGWSI
jgi:hypothetical protein